MAQDTFRRFAEQAEKTIAAPTRQYLAMVLDHAEAATHIQLEASRAYTNIALGNGQRAFAIKDADGFRDYVTSQLMVIKQLGERIKQDSEQMASTHQRLLDNTVEVAQQVTRGSVGAAQEAAEDGVQKVAAAT